MNVMLLRSFQDFCISKIYFLLGYSAFSSNVRITWSLPVFINIDLLHTVFSNVSDVLLIV